MYKTHIPSNSSIGSVPKLDGETIENKIKRIMSNDESISDGAPLIYTDKKDGIQAAYNIRTDRWEIATEAMHLVHTSQKDQLSNIAKSSDKGLPQDDKKPTGTDGSDTGSQGENGV
jgi:hypothetical protein